jgi:lipopolysaccharide transport system permease protein
MHKNGFNNDNWLYEIKPKSSFFELNFKEIWAYKDLLFLMVKRDVVTLYKQTILGPLWYLIQPLLTTITFTIIFNNVAGIETGKTPPFLFNLAAIIVWNYFSTSLTETSDTFKKNAAIFGKVYFPRVIITNLLKLGIQLLIFIGCYVYYVFNGMQVQLGWNLFIFPFLVFLMGVLGLGLGMIISSMVTKYKDLSFLVTFGIQLLMYVSAVIYPIALIQQKLPQYAWIVEYNPLAYIIEASRYVLLGDGFITLKGMLFTILVTIVLFFFGLLIFNKTEKSFIDTV